MSHRFVDYLLAGMRSRAHWQVVNKPVWHIPDAVCTVLDSWWWTERPSETCRVIFSKLLNCASSWFYYRNICKQCLIFRPCCLVQMHIYHYKTSCTTTRTDSRYHEHYYINYKHAPPPKSNPLSVSETVICVKIKIHMSLPTAIAMPCIDVVQLP
jgi:hypothetical protein